MENEVIFKRAVVGGFDCTQVMEYIAYLYEKQNELKAELEELGRLRAAVAELEAEIAEKDKKINELNAQLNEADNAARVGRVSAAVVKESIDYADSYVESAKVLAQDISAKTNERVGEAKDRIDSIMNYLDGISESLQKLYSSMDGLKGEYECFGDVYSEAETNEESSDRKVQIEAPAEDVFSTEAFPSDDDLTAFLSTMKAKYREMLDS